MKIEIGDKNKIKKSQIGHNINQDQKKSVIERHPLLFGFLTSSLVAFIFLFSFWKDIITWVENLFK